MAENDWATGTLKEAPFWREGMSLEEYEAERSYFYAHIEEYIKGTYCPQWKKREIVK
ncbi:MAG: hypothetical protein ACI4V3_04050 [Faecousia sp.]